MRRRNLLPRVEEALADTPAVLLLGARQTGKTTLARALGQGDVQARRYLTLDDAAVLAAARGNPAAFIGALDGPAVIDEVQFAPSLFPAIKAAIDRDRQPGRFLLTGSANVLLLPKLSESLAGRMELLNLWPFSQGELEGVAENLIDQLFEVGKGAGALTLQSGSNGDLWQRITRGGYPELQERAVARRRSAWFGSYVTTILQRDVREFANIDDPAALQRLLELLAARTGGLLNYSELSRSLSIPQSTLKRYFGLLEATFFLRRLPPWSTNLGKRLVKSPKTYLLDTGLTTSLLGIAGSGDVPHGTLRGALLENFVVMELTKQASWSETEPKLFHYRTLAGQEVDVLLEAPNRQLVGVEVKAAQAVSSSDFSGLRQLEASVGERFVRGVVLYGGDEVLAFADNLIALPVSSLWRAAL